MVKFSQKFKGMAILFESWVHENEHIAFISVGDLQLPFIGRGGNRLDAERALGRTVLEEMEQPDFFESVQRSSQPVESGE
jgi:hypothetical protein